MLKIVSFVGSFTGEKSHTKKASDMLADAVIRKAAEDGVEVSYECITADQLRIENCRGCASCFKTGICPLDSTDDMPLLKQKFLDADAIFLCTPVYLWDMSGITKTVIDRLSYWSHRFELAGKACVTVASTDASVGPDLEKRMKQYMSFFGASVADGITAKNLESPNINREDDIKPVMDAAADSLIAAWKDPAAFITAVQEGLWRARRRMIKQSLAIMEFAGIEPWDEIRVCIERGVADCRSFAEYVSKVKGEEDNEN
jgi:multimeric flavodoxin WrbA